jgi:hypothetical protein
MDPVVLTLVWIWLAAHLVPLVLMVRNWSSFWFSRFDPLSVGMARIWLGTLILLEYLALYPTWWRNYSRHGAASVDHMAWPTTTWFGQVVPNEFKASLFYWAEPFVSLDLFWWLAVVAALGFIVGFRTRWCTVLLFASELSMAHSNRMFVNGENSVFVMLLFYSCFAPMGARLSVDHWLARRRAPAAAEAEADWPMIWPVRLMQINLALIYLISLPHKLSFPEWIDGTAIYRSLAMSMWSRWPWPEVLYGGLGHALSWIATMSTVVIEGAFPLLVWFRRTRPYVLASAAFLHVMLVFTLQNMVYFTVSMVCAFWLFVPAETTRRALSIVGRAFRREPDPDPSAAKSAVG